MAEGWKVTGQIQVQGLQPGGGLGQFMEIHFLTEHGSAGQIRVPMAQYNVDSVRKLIQEQVDTMSAIHTL